MIKIIENVKIQERGITNTLIIHINVINLVQSKCTAQNRNIYIFFHKRKEEKKEKIQISVKINRD